MLKSSHSEQGKMLTQLADKWRLATQWNGLQEEIYTVLAALSQSLQNHTTNSPERKKYSVNFHRLHCTRG